MERSGVRTPDRNACSIEAGAYYGTIMMCAHPDEWRLSRTNPILYPSPQSYSIIHHNYTA